MPMRRTERLFHIIQCLRARRQPTTAADLATELGVSLRTLYRDMAELIAQQVPIRGEAGVGYVIDSSYDMPPLMLTPDELEAAVLGATWVAQRGDETLARGARDLIAKITAVVPERLRPVIVNAGLSAFTFARVEPDGFDVGVVRAAIRTHRKLRIAYCDAANESSERCVWPVTLGYTEQYRMIAAWCELRGGFRHFRADRVRSCTALDEAIPVPAHHLRRQWRATQQSSGCAPT
jgi:predicted DNA-binding transcriptional regulator YafY